MQASVNKELWHRLHQFGLLDERLIDHVWADIPHQKSALLALMQKFDLIAERLPSKGLVSCLPAILGKGPKNIHALLHLLITVYRSGGRKP